jgi:hypothetical protein
MSELLDDPRVLEDRVAQVRVALAGPRSISEIEVRVAASVMHLGLVARLLSPVLAEATILDRSPSVVLSDLWWRPELGGAFPLSVPSPTGSSSPDDPAPRASGVGYQVLDGLIGPLSDRVGSRFGVSRQVLAGNVVSALNGSVRMLAAARPEWADRALVVASALRQSPWLVGENSALGSGFRRRSCCLIYRAGPAGPRGVCGDCVLVG